MDEIRPLFILSADFGELVLAMNFLDGQRFAGRSTLVLPERLYRHNGDRLPISADRYTSLEDILDAVATHEPDIVFLFSGYLFATNHLLSPRAVDRLVQHLRRRGCCIVTSDPFIGLSSQLTLGDIDLEMALAPKPAVQRWILRWLMSRRDRNSRVIDIPTLSDAIHLYPAPACAVDGGDGVRRVSFSNTGAVGTGGGGPDAGGCDGRAVARDGGAKPRWLFVLASTDNAIQHALHGKAGFTELLLQKLHQTVLAGRQPTLVAPLSLVKRLRLLRRQLPSLSEADLLPFCPYEEFMFFLMNSEYVFYWNMFTCSLLPRMTRELPAFFFDRGHLSRCFPRYYEAGLRSYFSGWQPTYLDQRQSLDPGVLAGLAAEQRLATRAVRESWRRSPTPEQLIDRLMAEDVE